MNITTPAGLHVEAKTTPVDYDQGLDFLISRLDAKKGAILSSGTEYPGRYSRWDIGFTDPALEIIATHDLVMLHDMRGGGSGLLHYAHKLLGGHPHIESAVIKGDTLEIKISKGDVIFTEETRGQQPSCMSVIRAFLDDLKECQDRFLGLYGAFGYDLLFAFDPVPLHHKRENSDKLFHLFLPDRLYTIDRRKELAFCHEYKFSFAEYVSKPLPLYQQSVLDPIFEKKDTEITCSCDDQTYKNMVKAAQDEMACGNIFEVVLSRTFKRSYAGGVAALYKRLIAHNPSPYQFMIQMGDEQLVGTSPEMFVRIENRRVESCPISGTIRRTGDPMKDADALKELLNSEKDEVELTMCTDVDRNDKARICKPGSIRILARRAIETYASLYHTVDHVEGILRDDVSPLDAFLSHMWAVTLTGAPKKIAAQFIEHREDSKRGWYGGAIGAFLFCGTVNTGITIRTVHIKNKVASYRAGATLVYDSNPQDEAEETRTKAQNFFSIFNAEKPEHNNHTRANTGQEKKVILIDNEDSFVHMLADYIRQTGAQAKTYRHTVPLEVMIAEKPDLVVHSPGPARPVDFNVPDKIRTLAALSIPQFGVCLGLQGMVEAFGGSLKTLNIPRQGKPWILTHSGQSFMTGISPFCRVAAYHALYANENDFPDAFDIIARNENGTIMAIAHKSQKLYAVQFHPESLMSLRDNTGLKIIENIMAMI